MSNYAYDVFISYRHTERDRAWAKWLLEALETYRVPKSLLQRGFPARIGKVFRDEDELPTSADLSTNIQQALENSRFLVVICSKDTPSSLWVDKEVATFRKLGRGDHIIPLLVEGDPGTSFPPSLITLKKPVKQANGTVIESDEPLEPIAADVRERRDEPRSTLRRLSLLRILSAILGCAFDDLRQRDHERQAKRQRIQYTVAAILALVIVSCSLYWWDYNKLKVAYYNTMVYQWGVPTGVGKLSKPEVAHKYDHYRIESKRRKIIHVQKENSAGILPQQTEIPPRQDVQYRGDGKPDRIIFKDYLGKVQLIKKYDYYQAEGKRKPDSIVVDLLSASLTPMAQTSRGSTWHKYQSSITRNSVVFDRNGFPVRVMYLNYYGVPKQDQQGAYGVSFENDDRGLAIKMTNLDQNAVPINNAVGYTCRTNQFDKTGNKTMTSVWGLQGEPCLDEYGRHQVNNTYDQWGNELSSRYYGIDQKPILDWHGMFLDSTVYDAKGHDIETLHYGLKGELVLGLMGWARSSSAYKGDGTGATSVKYYGVDGRPMMLKWGFHEYRCVFDERWNVLQQAYFDTLGKPAVDWNGIHCEKLLWDENGNIIEVRHLDGNGQLMNQEGYAIIRYKLDAKGNDIEVSYYETNEEPVLCAGAAKRVSVFDEKNQQVEKILYSTDQKPLSGKGETARIKYRYDEWGNVIEESYWDADGKQINNKDGYARIEILYEKGDQKQIKYFGANGKSVTPKRPYENKIRVISL